MSAKNYENWSAIVTFFATIKRIRMTFVDRSVNYVDAGMYSVLRRTRTRTLAPVDLSKTSPRNTVLRCCLRRSQAVTAP